MWRSLRAICFSLFQWVQTVSMQETSISQAKKMPLYAYVSYGYVISMYFCSSISWFHWFFERTYLSSTLCNCVTAPRTQFTTSYFTFLGSRRGTYQFCSWHLSMWATLVHPEKIEVFLQDPIQMVKNWTVSIFLGGCQKIRFVDFCGFARWQLVHGPFVVHSWWNGRKFRKIAALPTVSLRNSANKLKSLAYVFVNFVDSAIAKVRKGILGDGGWSDSKCGSQNKKIRNDIRDKAFEHLKKVTFCDYAYVLTCFSFNCFFSVQKLPQIRSQVCLETLPQKVSDGMPLSVVTSNIQGREVPWGSCELEEGLHTLPMYIGHMENTWKSWDFLWGSNGDITWYNQQ